MSSQPLTHHEILGLIEPFSRLGYQADLAASQRLDRRLLFRPVTHAGDSGVVETLALVSRGDRSFRVERRLSVQDGPDVELVATGDDPASLLERVRSVPLAQPFEVGPGYCIGFSGSVEAPNAVVALGEAIAHVGDWRLAVEADPVRGMAADVALTRATQDGSSLPDDLLAVLGREWGLLYPSGKGWAGTVRLRGRAAHRDARTRRRVQAAAAHLAATFAAPPARFHYAHHRARWLVALRRITPLVAALLLILAGAACARLDISNDATLRVLLMSSPPVLMILFFSLREVPRLELPPLPREANAGKWPAPGPLAKDGMMHGR